MVAVLLRTSKREWLSLPATLLFDYIHADEWLVTDRKSTFWLICPEIVIGKYVAITSNRMQQPDEVVFVSGNFQYTTALRNWQVRPATNDVLVPIRLNESEKFQENAGRLPGIIAILGKSGRNLSALL